MSAPIFCIAVQLHHADDFPCFVEKCVASSRNAWVWLMEPGEWMDIATTAVRDWSLVPESVIRFASAEEAKARVARYWKNNNDCKVVEIVPRKELCQVGWKPRRKIAEKRP